MIYAQAHRTHRVGWLRAAVLGANDGIVSTASLVIGVAAASMSHEAILLAGRAGRVAGASLACLAALSGLAARVGGAWVVRGAARVAIWGSWRCC